MGSVTRNFSSTRYKEQGSGSCCLPGISNLGILIYLFNFSHPFYECFNFFMACLLCKKDVSEMKKCLLLNVRGDVRRLVTVCGCAFLALSKALSAPLHTKFKVQPCFMDIRIVQPEEKTPERSSCLL